ncbi:MAG: hypothetical protein LAT54_08885 [Cryomorphaceae bacterium]|nr:hypothetical protein [Cryomorphaceae bacterium]
MKLGKTFVRSMVREVGRNYGKAISNHMLGDKHSTPYRRVGQSGGVAAQPQYTAGSSARKRMSKLDKEIRDFTRKTTERSTVSQALNVYDAYFEEVEEARRNGGAIDLAEAMFLVEKSHDVRRLILNSIEQLQILRKTDNVPLLEEKAEDVQVFVDGIDEALREKLDEFADAPEVAHKNAKSPLLMAVLSLVGLGEAYFHGDIKASKAYVQFSAWLVVVLTIAFSAISDNGDVLSNLAITGYFIIYVLFFSWRPAKKQEQKIEQTRAKQRELALMEENIRAVLKEM